jgi:hypothetical protein
MILRISLGVLLLNFLLFVFNRYLYLVLEKPKKHFAYDYNIAKELAIKLKNIGVNSVLTNQKELALRLKFYGINDTKDNNKHYLTNFKINSSAKSIDIKYHNKLIKKYYIHSDHNIK